MTQDPPDETTASTGRSPRASGLVPPVSVSVAGQDGPEVPQEGTDTPPPAQRPMADLWGRLSGPWTRVFRIVYPDGFTLDGAQFPSGRCVVDDTVNGLVGAATDIEHLALRRPGDRIEWAANPYGVAP